MTSEKCNRCKVVAVYKDMYKVSCGNDIRIVGITGSFRNSVNTSSEFPTVGDLVILNEGGLIERVDDRYNQLSRKRVGKKTDEQILAANIDIMFIVTSLNKEFNINKIGRYIVLAETNHIRPVLLLSKLDLCPNAEEYLEKVSLFYPALETIAISSKDNVGVDKIYDKINRGECAVFVGASGVGKSTLINKLLGVDAIKTHETREKDDKGRHTTTHRELYELENGAFVIDTPGIREIGLWINDSEVDEFQDIYILSRACKY